MTLFELLHELDARKIHYELNRHCDEAVMVTVSVPGERWEVEIFGDGHFEVEVFRSICEGLEGAEALDRLFAEHDRWESIEAKGPQG